MALTTEVADHFNMNLDDDPYWSESSWFSWAIPERGINGFFYNHFRPNMNCLLCGPAMWDRSGMHTWKFRFFDWQLMRQLPEGRFGVDYVHQMAAASLSAIPIVVLFLIFQRQIITGLTRGAIKG